MDTVLEGRINLVYALVHTLDRRGVGRSGQGGLLSLLLATYLFPEAALIERYDSSHLVPVHLVPAVLDPPCSSPACRK